MIDLRTNTMPPHCVNLTKMLSEQKRFVTLKTKIKPGRYGKIINILSSTMKSTYFSVTPYIRVFETTFYDGREYTYQIPNTELYDRGYKKINKARTRKIAPSY